MWVDGGERWAVREWSVMSCNKTSVFCGGGGEGGLFDFLS